MEAVIERGGKGQYFDRAAEERTRGRGTSLSDALVNLMAAPDVAIDLGTATTASSRPAGGWPQTTLV